jgi:hypothetical protein
MDHVITLLEREKETSFCGVSDGFIEAVFGEATNGCTWSVVPPTAGDEQGGKDHDDCGI